MSNTNSFQETTLDRKLLQEAATSARKNESKHAHHHNMRIETETPGPGSPAKRGSPISACLRAKTEATSSMSSCNHHCIMGLIDSYTLWQINIDPENSHCLVKTNLLTLSARVYVDLLESSPSHPII